MELDAHATEPMDPHGPGSVDPYGRSQMAEPLEPYRGGPLDPRDPYGADPLDPYGRSGGWQAPDAYYGPDGADQSGFVHDTSASAAGMDSQSYQRYTEQGAAVGIDPETGIAPRRLTDCVCAVIFVLYCIGMILLVVVVENKMVDGRKYSDLRRLTHGMDYQARLCGVDEGVEDKPFLFWCRSNPAEWFAPSALDLWNPSCVAECPGFNSSHSQVACLYPEQKYFCSSEANAACRIPGGQFGNVVNFHVQSQQSLVLTNPYNTKAVGGRFCMPVNKTLRRSILHGPLNTGVRTFGSFQDCWGVLFLATVLAVLLSYFYVLMMNECAKILVYGFLGVATAAFGISGLLLMLTAAPLPSVRAWNPFFANHVESVAFALTCSISLALVSVGCTVSGTVTHVVHNWGIINELIRASVECFAAMRSMLVPPVLEALFKFFLAWILTYNFMFLVSVGWVDDHRTEIDGQRFRGLNARFYFDWGMIPWILYYVYGAVWIMELCNAFGQFLVSFSVISWYFMKKEGASKTGVPPLPPLHGTLDAVVYHLGSLCLGAAIVPWVRPIRIFNWVLHEGMPNEQAECCGAFSVFNGVCQLVGKTCGHASDACRHRFTPACCSRKGCTYKYSKIVYSDIIIRSQHFLPASEHTFIIINNHKACQMYLMSLTVITIIGVLSIGAICAFATYIVIIRTGSLHDPMSSKFIVSPMAVSVFAFILCGNIAYGFTLLFDHSADTLLYCYAWNKKYNKDTIEQFMPESLRDLVGHIIDKEDGYQYFGAARPEMYLATWMPKKGREGARPGRSSQSLAPQTSFAPQTSLAPQAQPSLTNRRSPEPSYAGIEDPSAQYVGTGYMPPEQQEPEGYYYGGSAYTGRAYDTAGRYVGSG